LFKQSPSLKSYAAEVFAEVWQDALEDVQANYPEVPFPEEWGLSQEMDALLSEEFWGRAI
jgi:hypothetical protein